MTPTLILTRPTQQGQGFADAVLAQWTGSLDIVQSPLLAVVFGPVSEDLRTVTDLVFTSANGVAAAKGLALPRAQTAWCVGAKTAAAAQAAGFTPVVGPGDAAGLVGAIIKAMPQGRFAHIRGRHARGNVSNLLTSAGISCRDIVAYDQKACALTEDANARLARDAPVVMPLFSPRTVDILADQAPFTAPIHAAMMSEAVADAARPLHLRSVTIAEQPDEDAMLAATLTLLRRLTHLRD
ncbi:MAG: uroporphyrinogen-III synthase [Pseudomonadota bacterium]